jgi:SsrA-binding protein
MAKQLGRKILVQNRKARHNYTILSTLEAGIILGGSEVKSLRKGQGNLLEAFASDSFGEMLLLQAFIPEYKEASHFNHDPKRPRKLLLHKREIGKLIGQIKKKGVTLVPLSLYLNPKGKIKVELGVAEGKTKGDKREAKKADDWRREKERLLKKSTKDS